MEELGRTLKQQREEQGITLDEIADATKIPRRHLEAMEAGAFWKLPGLVYARAFLRHYAKIVNLDADELVATLDAAIERERLDEPSKGRRTGRHRKRRERRRLPAAAWQWLGAAAFLLVLGIGLASILNGDKADPGGVSEAVPPVQVAVERPPAGLDFEEADPVGALDAGADMGAPVGEALPDQPLSEHAAAAIPAGEGEDPGLDSQVGGGAAAGAFHDEPVALAAADGPFEPGVVLDVEILRTCWFQVTADGVPIFEGALEPGERITWVAASELVVRFGRPEGVRLTLNGRYLGAAGTGVITRVFTPEGVRTVVPPAEAPAETPAGAPTEAPSEAPIEAPTEEPLEAILNG